MTAPKITFAFWSAASVTTSAASFTSKSPMSGPPLMLSSTPVAPSIDDSRSGDDTAMRAASPARFGPSASPMPMSAEPASRMIVRTSAKSRFTRPGTVMRSVMPWTPWRSTSSAMRNASTTEVSCWTTWSSRSFGITISVSTWSWSAEMPELRLLGALAALEGERPRDDADRQRSQLAGSLRDDRRAARPGAAALARGDEDHVRALERLLDLVAALERRGLADLGIRAGAEAARRGGADMELHVGVAHEQRLRVGVHRDELDALQACVDHAVDRVRSSAADADDFDHR